MTKLKNGLYVDFKWDEDEDIPIVTLSDRSDLNGYVLHMNLKEVTFEEAVKQALNLFPKTEEVDAY